MSHRLTDEICDALWDEHGEYYALYEEVRLTCRAAYDLGFKAGGQAAEGAMKAIIDTIRENSKAMEMLAMGEEES